MFWQKGIVTARAERRRASLRNSRISSTDRALYLLCGPHCGSIGPRTERAHTHVVGKGIDVERAAAVAGAAGYAQWSRSIQNWLLTLSLATFARLRE